MHQLLVTPHPNPYESLNGYILRIVDLNGYPSPAWLKRALGIKRLQQEAKQQLSKLASAVGVDVSILSGLVAMPIKGRCREVIFGGHNVLRYAVESRVCRYCPKCLKEDGYFKSTWQLRPLAACPKHGITLIDRCPGCKETLDWDREKLLACSCGHDLTSSPCKPADPLLQELCADIERAFSSPRKSTLMAILPVSFAGLTMGDLLSQLMLLAGYASGRGRGWGAHLAARLSGDALVETYTRVASMFPKWPRSYYRFLEDLRYRSGEDSTQSGLEKEFGTFYHAVCGPLAPESGRSPVRAAFQDYVASHWSGGFITAKNTRLFGDNSSNSQHIPLRSAAMSLGCHPSILVRDATDNLLKISEAKAGSRTLRLVDRDELERYRAYRDGLIDLEGAAPLLGVSKTSVLELVRRGLLKASRGPLVDGHRVWMFRKPEVQRLLQSVTDRINERPKDRTLRSFHYTLRRGSFRGVTIADIVRAIQSDDLPVRGRRKKLSGFCGLEFDEGELAWFLQGPRRYIEWGVTIRRAGRILKLNDEATRDLVKFGHLETRTDVSTGRPRPLVAYSAIEAFRETYVSASEIAVRMKTSARNAVAKLKEIGIEAATGPAIDGGRQYFFQRCHLPKNLDVIRMKKRQVDQLDISVGNILKCQKTR